uniref:Transmembrane protein with EGF-like and two follistatin-like domains 1a n=1 Tax=Hippocampus comes TaxID=109280 RepID=A0A3Q3DYT0_HIPCM
DVISCSSIMPSPASSSSSSSVLFLVLLLLLLPSATSATPRGGGAALECGPGKNAEYASLKKSDLRVCDAGTCRFGGTCRENGADIKCVCHFQCHKKFLPVCASNGDTYQNECFLRRAACKKQRAISIVAEGACDHGNTHTHDNGSGSSHGKKTSKCENCKFGAECDEDSEDMLCMCNIVCNGHNDNPVCGSDSVTYETPCHVREASCLKQMKIDIRHVGRCQGNVAPDTREGEGLAEGSGACPPDHALICVHGQCEMRSNQAMCRCSASYGGPRCDQLMDFNILYVVPSGQKLHYVLIAGIIGAVQIAIIVALVMCFTRRCNKAKRGRRQKQHLGHFPSGTSSRMM